jgi:putative toxin-antitoxin system antitoxin component (TIGR02293 family)
MKKKINIPLEKKSTTSKQDNTTIVEEASTYYFVPSKQVHPSKNINHTLKTKEFTFKEFKKIADIAPFTLSEWASYLHISERTLQRYAADNSTFNGLQIERILHLEKLIHKGNALFGKGFRQWLISAPFSLNFTPPKDMLMTYEGIQELIDILGRIEHGISA